MQQKQPMQPHQQQLAQQQQRLPAGLVSAASRSSSFHQTKSKPSAITTARTAPFAVDETSQRPSSPTQQQPHNQRQHPQVESHKLQVVAQPQPHIYSLHGYSFQQQPQSQQQPQQPQQSQQQLNDARQLELLNQLQQQAQVIAQQKLLLEQHLQSESRLHYPAQVMTLSPTSSPQQLSLQYQRSNPSHFQPVQSHLFRSVEQKQQPQKHAPLRKQQPPPPPPTPPKLQPSVYQMEYRAYHDSEIDRPETCHGLHIVDNIAKEGLLGCNESSNGSQVSVTRDDFKAWETKKPVMVHRSTNVTTADNPLKAGGSSSSSQSSSFHDVQSVTRVSFPPYDPSVLNEIASHHSSATQRKNRFLLSNSHEFQSVVSSGSGDSSSSQSDIDRFTTTARADYAAPSRDCVVAPIKKGVLARPHTASTFSVFPYQDALITYHQKYPPQQQEQQPQQEQQSQQSFPRSITSVPNIFSLATQTNRPNSAGVKHF